MPATPFLAVCFPNMKHSYGICSGNWYLKHLVTACVIINTLVVYCVKCYWSCNLTIIFNSDTCTIRFRIPVYINMVCFVCRKACSGSLIYTVRYRSRSFANDCLLGICNAACQCTTVRIKRDIRLPVRI